MASDIFIGDHSLVLSILKWVIRVTFCSRSHRWGVIRVSRFLGITLKLLFLLGTLTTLFKGDDRCVQSYFSAYPGYYDTCDAGIRDEWGYIHILAREDDVINVAGHRLSTSALEEVVLKVAQKNIIHPPLVSSI